jgi:hypothetical protein
MGSWAARGEGSRVLCSTFSPWALGDPRVSVAGPLLAFLQRTQAVGVVQLTHFGAAMAQVIHENLC